LDECNEADRWKRDLHCFLEGANAFLQIFLPSSALIASYQPSAQVGKRRGIVMRRCNFHNSLEDTDAFLQIFLLSSALIVIYQRDG
jgi:hypothetical protein